MISPVPLPFTCRAILSPDAPFHLVSTVTPVGNKMHLLASSVSSVLLRPPPPHEPFPVELALVLTTIAFPLRTAASVSNIRVTQSEPEDSDRPLQVYVATHFQGLQVRPHLVSPNGPWIFRDYLKGGIFSVASSISSPLPYKLFGEVRMDEKGQRRSHPQRSARRRASASGAEKFTLLKRGMGEQLVGSKQQTRRRREV